MRTLKMKHVFQIIDILNTLVPENINDLLQGDAKQIGKGLFTLILKNIPICKDELYIFLASYLDKKPEEAEDIDFDELLTIFEELGKSNIIQKLKMLMNKNDKLSFLQNMNVPKT